MTYWFRPNARKSYNVDQLYYVYAIFLRADLKGRIVPRECFLSGY